MSAKNEIIRRLKKKDYSKIAKELYSKSFDDLSIIEYKDILKITDIYGAKYKKLYKLKDDVDIKTITSNLTTQAYTPNFNEHFDLQIIGISKNDDSFTIYTEFYTTEEIWVDIVQGGQKYKKQQKTNFRRIMTLEKKPTNNYLVISIDPIGEGANAYKELDKHLDTLKNNIGLNFNDFFDTIDIEKAIYDLIADEKLIPNKLIAKDEATNRIKSVYTQASKDNIKDEAIYDSCENSDLKLQNIKMKFQKESIEVFGKTLLKISTKTNKKITDELTENIISAL